MGGRPIVCKRIPVGPLVWAEASWVYTDSEMGARIRGPWELPWPEDPSSDPPGRSPANQGIDLAAGTSRLKGVSAQIAQFALPSARSRKAGHITAAPIRPSHPIVPPSSRDVRTPTWPQARSGRQTRPIEDRWLRLGKTMLIQPFLRPTWEFPKIRGPNIEPNIPNMISSLL